MSFVANKHTFSFTLLFKSPKYCLKIIHQLVSFLFLVVDKVINTTKISHT
jgi:hypothetical protein